MDKAARVRVLNVNDDEAGRYLTTRTLHHACFDVLEAASGWEALRRAEELPDVIVLDVRLPDLSGLDVCRILKRTPHLAHIPVLHLSATMDAAELWKQGRAAGADAVLALPCRTEELVGVLRGLLHQRRRQTLSESRRALGRAPRAGGA